ncbi:hypothetical protein EI546_14470 [Aequorivita sp. H23M31]|uniref:Outer membrane protein beta-barrel domain-containing protein n=1 Tax=Aequorivita ciconiae TaxID=2494375 RepID=A0A410G6E2_9FLAO|nr:hypothetical protein [Aequorivita sp. H23M31]QAA82847.1 hypothetical protein EI546_14470 [Aequorivita sp. H23M31]
MGKSFIFFGTLLLLGTYALSAQEVNSRQFAYRSFSISPLGIYGGENSGIIVSADVSFDYGKNIFSLEGGSGTEGNFFGNSSDFYEINLTYGRSYPLNENLFTDIFIGAGYFHYNTYNGRNGDTSESTIGFPIGAKFQYMLGSRFSMGLKLGANINSFQTLGTLGLVLQWNRKTN